MAENKTQKTKASVTAFIAGIEDPERRKDAKALAALIAKATGDKAAMWGTAIVGYGDMTYEGSGGRTVDWFPVGFSPRKAALTIYLMGGLKAHADLVERLGRYKVGGGCLYIKSLADIDTAVLATLITKTKASNITKVRTTVKGKAPAKKGAS